MIRILSESDARAVAAGWQSPGSHGRGFAQYASTGIATRALIDDIEREIVHAPADDVRLLEELCLYLTGDSAHAAYDYPNAHVHGTLSYCLACTIRCYCDDLGKCCVGCADGLYFD